MKVLLIQNPSFVARDFMATDEWSRSTEAPLSFPPPFALLTPPPTHTHAAVGPLQEAARRHDPR